jgi:bacteriorhodopsin
VYGYILLRASWIRYVDWSLTFSLTLVILGLVSGVEFTSLFASIVAALVLTLAGFHGEAWYIEKIGWYVHVEAC